MSGADPSFLTWSRRALAVAVGSSAGRAAGSPGRSGHPSRARRTPARTLPHAGVWAADQEEAIEREPQDRHWFDSSHALARGLEVIELPGGAEAVFRLAVGAGPRQGS